MGSKEFSIGSPNGIRGIASDRRDLFNYYNESIEGMLFIHERPIKFFFGFCVIIGKDYVIVCNKSRKWVFSYCRVVYTD